MLHPVRADDTLQQILKGIGAAVIINEAAKAGAAARRKDETAQDKATYSTGTRGSSGGSGKSTIDSAERTAMEIQRNLNTIGFDAGPVDGRPGQQTFAAVKAFQTSRGFPATGELTSVQRMALATDTAKLSGDTSAVRHSRVLEAQTYLHELGYSLGTPDGKWGPQSQAALTAFRRDMGMGTASQLLDATDTAALYQKVHNVAPVELGGDPAVATTQTALARNRSGLLKAAPSYAASEIIHIGYDRFVSTPPGFERRLALMNIKRDPSVLDADHAVDAFYISDRQASEPERAGEIIRQVNQMNPLEKDDLRKNYYQQLIKEAQSVLEISPEASIPIAIYIPVNPGEFVEGSGLTLSGIGAQRFQAKSSKYDLGRLSVRIDLPGLDRIPLSRDEAKAFIDRVATARTEQQRPVQVIWGRITRFGTDESIENFARQQDRNGVPTTFIADKVALYLAEHDSYGRSDPIAPTTAELYTWPVGSAAPAEASGSRPALELARELGLPIESGHVVGNTQAEGWTTFNALAFVGANPDYAREEDRFAGVAATLLTEAQQRAFFGDSTVGHYGKGVDLIIDRHGFDIAQNAFPDEFVRQDAKRKFFEGYYEQILSRTPVWPLPVINKVKVGVGEYDFDTQSFPLNYDYGQMPVYRVVSLPSGDNRQSGLVSAERFTNLPKRLEIPSDQARALRQAIQGNHILLAWWADFDWSIDTSEIEKSFGSNDSRSFLRPGQATLKRVTIFADEAMTWPLLEIEPANLLVPVPEVQSAAQENNTKIMDNEAHLALIQPAPVEQILAAVARGLGGGDAVFERIAKTQDAVTQANEFEEAAAINKVVATLRSSPEGPFWLEGRIDLGRYDLPTQSFQFAEARERGFEWRLQVGQTRIEIGMVGEIPFSPLPVEEALARQIVESGNRNAKFLVELSPEVVTDNSRGDSLAYKLLARTEQVIFYREDSNTSDPSVVLGQTSFRETNSAAKERLARRFSAEEFGAITSARLPMTQHVLDLLAVDQGTELSDPTVETMMIEAWRHEAAYPDQVGPRFFTTDEKQPDTTHIALYRPSFRSYLEAKAAALGSRYSIRLVGQNADICRDAIAPGAIYGGRPILEAVPTLQEDVYAIAQEVRKHPGAFKVNQRYGIFQQRASTQGPYCEQWYGLFVLKNGVYEGSAATDTVATVIEFDLEEIRVFEGPGAVPELLVIGETTATWIERRDGSISNPLVPVEPEFAAEDKEPVEAVQAPNTDKAQTAPDVNLSDISTGDTNADTPALDAVWPDLTDFGVKLSTRDLLGLHLGQPMSAAHEVASQLDGVEDIYENALPEDGAKGFNPLAYKRLYVRSGGSETLTLFSFKPQGPVLGIMRRMVLSSGVLPYEQIVAAVEDKYGMPKWRREDANVLGWGNGSSQHCFAIPYDWSFSGREGYRRFGGEGGETVNLAWEHSATLTIKAPEIISAYTGCGEIVSYVTETPQEYERAGFNVVLIDFDALAAAEAASKPDSETADFEIKF